jgi:hypothetical protein
MPDTREEADDQALEHKREDQGEHQVQEHDDEPVETPFDHPLFLPVVLLGLSLWFLWDGFIVPMEDHLAFNRWGFAVLATATAYFGYKGIRELRETRERKQTSSGRGEDSPRAS